MAFKVGDRVRLKESAIYGDTPQIKGREGVIVDVSNDRYLMYPYEVDCNGTKQVFRASEMELIAPADVPAVPQPAQSHDYMLGYAQGYHYRAEYQYIGTDCTGDNRAGFIAGYQRRQADQLAALLAKLPSA